MWCGENWSTVSQIEALGQFLEAPPARGLSLDVYSRKGVRWCSSSRGRGESEWVLALDVQTRRPKPLSKPNGSKPWSVVSDPTPRAWRPGLGPGSERPLPALFRLPCHPCNFQAGSPDWTTAFGRSLLGPQSPIQNAARLRPPGLCSAAQTLGRKCATGRRDQPHGQAFVLSPPVVVRNNGARRRRPPTHDGGPASSRHLCRCFESNRPTTDPGSMGRSIGACGPRPRGRMGACAEGLRPRAQGVLSIHQVIGLEWQRDLIQMLCSRPSALT